eukprot:scaffold707136_cov59-Attheya_sp.AAC.1
MFGTLHVRTGAWLMAVLSCAGSVLLIPVWAAAAAGSAQTYDATAVRRERNLDHWDAETFCAYLGIDPVTLQALPATGKDPRDAVDQYAGIDAAVMFYAQWDTNSHSIAPTWDAVATHLQAGTKEANVIMALFDCEKDQTHLALCSLAGITHYPTFIFVGAGPFHDNDIVTRTILGPDKSAGPAGKAKLRRTVKYQGSFQYGDEILDWVRAMHGLSTWHTRTANNALLKFIRHGIFRLFFGGAVQKKKVSTTSLPVGVPPSLGGPTRSSSSTTTTASSSSSSAADQTEINQLKTQVELSEKGKKEFERAATHGTLLIDAQLFPRNPPAQLWTPSANTTDTTNPEDTPLSSSSTFVDVFTVMDETHSWEARPTSFTAKPEHQILRSCVLELSLDYCTRLSAHKTQEFLDELFAATGGDESKYPPLSEMEANLKEKIGSAEPFCVIFDTCLAQDFPSTNGCQPTTCPFQNEATCRYLTACFDDTIATEYAKALKFVPEDGKYQDVFDTDKKTSQPTTSNSQTDESAKKTGAWGF